MKLMKSTTSPYGRLAHAALIEAGAEPEIDLLNPWADPAELIEINPARRVPTLILDDGTVLTESYVIAAYARDIAPEGSHLKSPAPGAYEIAGLAQGVIDAAVYIMTGRKITSDDLANPAFDAHPVAARRRRAMVEGLTRLDAMADRLSETEIGLAEIGVVNAVQYIDFRFPGADWRPEIPALDAYVARVIARPSLQRTIPS
ncbi:glutathione S-transferase [Limimaricola variabilis]|uniref:Glutathione S-transferase n=1 Tax=Limimaricola variabilis TaxID=1492771 RepID=A0ABR6HIZ2_9RHOB|nr:glutathione S-transferase N-terminal domain-containing protein [Limimaricola variabilis]MBB3710512.1 glutathione S-transferase [Limimaricola variabilis]